MKGRGGILIFTYMHACVWLEIINIIMACSTHSTAFGIVHIIHVHP